MKRAQSILDSIGLMSLVAMHCGSFAAMPFRQNTPALVAGLERQGISLESIMGVDANGIPMICGTGFQTNRASGIGPLDVLPVGMRSWECVPGVIRNDGIDWFRLEVNVNGPVSEVLWGGIQEYYITSESGTNYLRLRDDGLNGDRVAGDYVFTSERCRYRAEIPMPPTQYSSTNTPAGIYIRNVGQLTVIETNSADNSFLIPPSLAVLNTNIPAVEMVMLASNIQASAHLINLITTNRDAQKALRIGSDPGLLTRRIYAVLPDAFDFLAFFTTDHLEYIPQLTSANFISGRFFPVSVNFTGTGLFLYDSSSSYGSRGRLKGLPIFDIMERGIGNSKNATHEISHQWSAYVTTSLNITTGDGHYHRDCSINSILGGQYKPVTNQTGGIIRQCTFGEHFEATPLDKYMMGLVSTSAVSPLYVSSNILAIACGAVITNLRPIVTIAQIVAAHGVRTPGPESSQKSFSIGFVAASHNRPFNATEMTFYDLMAAHFTKALPLGYAPPELTDGWVPITKFFGEGTTWSSDVLALIRPMITGIQMLTNGMVRVSGSGYPGRSHRLFGTTNFLQWTVFATNTASSSGSILFQDSTMPKPGTRFYRASTP